jgi:hypothetical protein
MPASNQLSTNETAIIFLQRFWTNQTQKKSLVQATTSGFHFSQNSPERFQGPIDFKVCISLRLSNPETGFGARFPLHEAFWYLLQNTNLITCY